MQQILDISLRSLDRRKFQLPALQPDRRSEIDHLLDDLLMYLRIAHDALLADLLPACLELWLDQADDLTVLRHQLPHRRQHLHQRNKRNVNRDKGCRLLDLLRRHITDVRLFHADDPRVIAQLPVEQSVSDIHRIDLYRAILQHTVGKASGRSSDIHAHPALQSQVKMTHRLFQLESAAADIFQLAALYRDLRLHVDHRPGLVLALAVDQYVS